MFLLCVSVFFCCCFPLDFSIVCFPVFLFCLCFSWFVRVCYMYISFVMEWVGLGGTKNVIFHVDSKIRIQKNQLLIKKETSLIKIS